jgi:hypothetical protein
MIYNPFFRSEEQRKKLSVVNKGKIGSNKNTKVITINGKRKHVKN